MAANILDSREDKNGVYFTIGNTNVQDLSNHMGQFLSAQGYKLESGAPDNGVWGKGNKTMRILFGAFVKRFSFDVRVREHEGNTLLHFSKNEKGMIGGVIGVNQVKNETARLKGEIARIL